MPRELTLLVRGLVRLGLTSALATSGASAMTSAQKERRRKVSAKTSRIKERGQSKQKNAPLVVSHSTASQSLVDQSNSNSVKTQILDFAERVARMDEADAFLFAAQDGELEYVAAHVASSDGDWRNPAGNTALMLACATDQTEVVKLLLLSGPGMAVNAVNVMGDCALLFASLNGPGVLDLLLAHPAVDLRACNAEGMDALSLSLISTHPQRLEVTLHLVAKMKKEERLRDKSYLATAVKADNLGGAELLLLLGEARVTEEVLNLAAKKLQIGAALRSWLKKQEAVAAVFEEQLSGGCAAARPYDLADLVQGSLLKLLRAEMASNNSVKQLVEEQLSFRWLRRVGGGAKKKKKGKKVPLALLESAESELNVLRAALRERIPLSEAADVRLGHVMGLRLDEALSMTQLELLRQYHAEQSRKVDELIRGAEVKRLVEIAIDQLH